MFGANGGPLRSRSTASEQPMFDFGPRTRFLCAKLGKVWLDGPPFVAVPGLLPGAELAMGVGEQG